MRFPTYNGVPIVPKLHSLLSLVITLLVFSGAPLATQIQTF